jgi:hypothetical protein
MAIDSRFVVNISGKLYLRYGGVLAEAIEQGLRSLEVEILQFPSEGNGNTAVCKATAVLEREGIVRTFIEIGDAAPNNCAPMVRTALLRMSATRAKGRALRDAVGHGEALADEIGGEQEPAPQKTDWTPAKEASPLVRDQFCNFENCGIELTPGQAKFSKIRYGKPTCPEHQKASKAITGE